MGIGVNGAYWEAFRSGSDLLSEVDFTWAIGARFSRTPTPEDRMKARQQSMTLLDRPIGEKAGGMHTPLGNVRYTADNVNVDGTTVKLRGHARISAPTFIVTADEAEYRQDSGQIDSHGDVHIRMIAPNTRK
jgi:hypothetical protein